MFLEQLIAGLTVGTTYALLALGYSMVFGVLSFINFAHGDVAMVGAYVCWFMFVEAGWGLGPAMVLAIAAGVVLGVLIEKIGYLPIRRASRLAAMLVSLGFSFVLATAVQIVFGTEPQHMPQAFEVTTFKVLNTAVSSLQILILLFSLALMAALHLFVQKTRLGTALRATSLDKETAGLMGVDINGLISLTFAIGSGLAVVSAIMLGVYYGTVYPSMGGVIGMKGFTAVVLGGTGSIPGAMAGGILMGLLESLGGAYISTRYANAIAFFVLILTLLLRPAGLLGRTISKE
ncbi:MAG: branched-chain amino acid ABC transporter permease [Firmicutes bacterium]|nr:branched-chain amino acid ABC transporter permease [Bacillota bacterium]